MELAGSLGDLGTLLPNIFNHEVGAFLRFSQISA
jgi:hypothetical protein